MLSSCLNFAFQSLKSQETLIIHLALLALGQSNCGQENYLSGLYRCIIGYVCVGSSIDQDTDGILPTVYHGQMQRCISQAVAGVHVGTALQQEVDDFGVAFAGGNV